MTGSVSGSGSGSSWLSAGAGAGAVLAAVVGVAASLALIAWLGTVAHQGRPVPGTGAGTGAHPDHVAPVRAPSASRAEIKFPKEACPAVDQAILAMHFKEINGTATQLYVADLFKVALEQKAKADAERELRRQKQRERQRLGVDVGPRPGGGRRARGVRTASNTTTMVCYVLVGLLVISAALSVAEVVRERWTSAARRANSIGFEDCDTNSPGCAAGAGAGAGAGLLGVPSGRGRTGRRPTLSRRCSLVDLTVMRHERRESLAQAAAAHAHAHAHGHGSHQPGLGLSLGLPGGTGGTGASVPNSLHLLGARPPPLLRRSSTSACAVQSGPPGPARPPAVGEQAAWGWGWSAQARGSIGGLVGGAVSASASASGTNTPLRRPSVDASDGDSSPDTARKRQRVRFIRRH